MKFIKKHPYLFFELIGIILAIIVPELYVNGIIENLDFVVVIFIITMVYIIVVPFLIKSIRHTRKLKESYDKSIKQYQEKYYYSCLDKLAFKEFNKSANVVLIIGVIMLIPSIFLEIISIIKLEFGLIILFMVAIVFAGIMPIIMGNNRKKHPEKYIEKFKQSFIPISSVNIYITSIEVLFKDLIDKRFNLSREKLFNNGAIYYTNGVISTKDCWNKNSCISPFVCYFENRNVTIEVYIFKEGKIVVSLYDENQNEKVCNSLTKEIDPTTSKDIAILMNAIADRKGLVNKNITELDFCYTSTKVDEEDFEIFFKETNKKILKQL